MRVGFWSSAAFIARKDIQYSLRARETMLWVFLMPVVFFYFIGTVTGGFGGPGPGAQKPKIGLVAPEDSGFLAERVAQRLEQQDFQVIRGPEAESEARRVRLPEAFTESALGGGGTEVVFFHRGEGLTADYEQVRVARAVYTVLADVIVSGEGGETPGPEAFEKLDAMPRALRLEVRSAGQRQRIPTGFEQAIPGTMVMFTMLVLLTGGAVPLVIERRAGLLRRLASSPIPRGAVVLGKWGGKMALAMVQIAFAMLAGTLLFGMEWGRSLPMVLLVLFAWASFNASLALLLGSVARTEGQAVGVGVVTSMALGALGGCWWPIEVTAEWMQTLASFLPTGWAMGALHQLVSFAAGAPAALPQLLAISFGALLLGWLSVRGFRFVD